MRLVTLVKSKLYQISDKLVHQGLRYGVCDGTFEAKKDQPKLIIRTLVITHKRSKIVDSLRSGLWPNSSNWWLRKNSGSDLFSTLKAAPITPWSNEWWWPVMGPVKWCMCWLPSWRPGKWQRTCGNVEIKKVITPRAILGHLRTFSGV